MKTFVSVSQAEEG